MQGKVETLRGLVMEYVRMYNQKNGVCHTEFGQKEGSICSIFRFAKKCEITNSI